MIRFGLAVGKSKRVFRSAAYGQDWEVISLASVTALQARMMTLLPQPYGLFSWLCEVVGPRRAVELPIDLPQNATEIAQTLREQMWAEHTPRPRSPVRPPSPPKTISTKRKTPPAAAAFDTIVISDDYDTDEMTRKTPKKRPRPDHSLSRFPPSQEISTPEGSDLDVVPKKPRKFRSW